ncbi:putative pumilio protein [Podospora fimiseda]|uniref:Pumilio protein n=1 Tax=Podospora fimiseda TaxID=252190 RepID=A0AAN7GZY6_9PEZI|nr:putative pumilio protein [Podospora fimiseda]
MTSSNTQRPSNGATVPSANRSRGFPFSPDNAGNDLPPLPSFPPPSNNGWHNPNIWSTNNAIGRFSKGRESLSTRDPNDSFTPSGSSALAATSEADGWTGRGAPWSSSNGPTLRNVSGTTSPNRTRADLNEVANRRGYYHSTQPASQRAVNGSNLSSALESSNGGYKFNSPFSEFNDDNDNGVSFNNKSEPEQKLSRFTTHRPSQDTSFLGSIVGGPSQNSPMASSNNSDDDIHGQSNHFGALVTGSHAQRPSLTGPSSSFHSQNGSRSYDGAVGTHVSEEDLSGRVGRLSLSQNTQLNPISQPWENSQGYQGAFSRDSNYQINLSYERNGSAVDHSSPAGSTYHGPGLSSPSSFSNTPQPPLDTWSRSAAQDHRLGFDDRRNFHPALAAQQNYYQNSFYPNYGGFEGTYGNARPPIQYNGYQVPVAQYPFPPGGVAPTRPSRGQDPTTGLRSIKLEEFKSSPKSISSRWELKDIFGHVVEFAGDQHGSRFIQNKLITANSDDKDRVFCEIQPNSLALIKDLFGNYVIQKLFEHGNQAQKQILASVMKGQVFELSKQMYACRVVQKALSHVLVEQQAELVKELEPNVLEIVKDQNGNHVIQKVIQTVQRPHIGFIFDCLKGRVAELSTHTYGCRVIQRAMESGTDSDKAAIMKELHVCAQSLMTDQYGNYVTQHVVTAGLPEDRDKMIAIVMAHLPTFSKHKFASNVVEKCIVHATAEQKREIRDRLMGTEEDGLLTSLIKDQFGNYVLQTIIKQLKGEDKEVLIRVVQPLLMTLKKSCAGKQMAGIDRVLTVIHEESASTVPPSPALHVDINSAVPTPNLTMGPNSPSSSPPSTNEGAIEESISHPDTKLVGDVTVKLQPTDEI